MQGVYHDKYNINYRYNDSFFTELGYNELNVT